MILTGSANRSLWVSLALVAIIAVLVKGNVNSRQLPHYREIDADQITIGGVSLGTLNSELLSRKGPPLRTVDSRSSGHVLVYNDCLVEVDAAGRAISISGPDMQYRDLELQGGASIKGLKASFPEVCGGLPDYCDSSWPVGPDWAERKVNGGLLLCKLEGSRVSKFGVTRSELYPPQITE